MGYSFDLNNPKTFSEKIQWHAFNWHYEEIVKATDKVLFKEYIEKRLGPGYTIPLLGHWTDIKVIFITINNVLRRKDINSATAATMEAFDGNN